VTARACSSLIRPSSNNPSVAGSRVHSCSAFFNLVPAVTGASPSAAETSSLTRWSFDVSPLRHLGQHLLLQAVQPGPVLLDHQQRVDPLLL